MAKNTKRYLCPVVEPPEKRDGMNHGVYAHSDRGTRTILIASPGDWGLKDDGTVFPTGTKVPSSIGDLTLMENAVFKDVVTDTDGLTINL